MNNKDPDWQNIRKYGLHGALGLLMGAGIGAVLSIIFLTIISHSEIIYLSIFCFYLIVFIVFGVYMEFIFKKNDLSKLGAVAGIVCGIMAVILYSVLAEVNSQTRLYATSIIITGIAGLTFGIPKIKNMVLMAVSGLLGGAAGIGLYISGQRLTYFLKYTGMQHEVRDISFITAIIALLMFSILAIGTAGASIGIGLYVTKGTEYLKRDLPGFLKILRIAGIGLILLILAVMTIIFVSYANYASASSHIRINSGADEMTVYVPVLLDDKGKILTMYEHPKITGNATTSIILGELGTVFQISGRGNVDIDMQQSYGIQMGKQPEEAFAGFGVSTGNYTAGEDVQTAEVWIYSAGEIDECSIYMNLDTGWGQALSIMGKIGLVEGWQNVGLLVRALNYD